MLASGEQATDTVRLHYNPIITSIMTMPKPVIAALNGSAAGAGASLALACDLRVAARRASLLMAFARVGLGPDSGASWTLQRLVGAGRAAELLMLAEPVDADRALAAGLLTSVVADDELAGAARALAVRLAEGPTAAYAAIKAALVYAAAHPLPEALEKEKIGGMVDPNLEKIQSFRPDLIIGFRGNPLGVLNKLRNLHFPVFVLNLGSSLDGLFQTIEKVGRVTRAEDPAKNLVAGLKEKRQAIGLALRDVSKKPKVFLSVYGQGLWTCGEGSYLNDLLVQAGGVNIAGHIPRRWLQLNREQLIHENPHVIIIMAKDKERFSQAGGSFRADPRLKDVRAVKDKSIHWLDENIAGRFGPRLIDALDTVARILHPEIFEARK